jgi:hypothetical protein
MFIIILHLIFCCCFQVKGFIITFNWLSSFVSWLLHLIWKHHHCIIILSYCNFIRDDRIKSSIMSFLSSNCYFKYSSDLIILEYFVIDHLKLRHANYLIKFLNHIFFRKLLIIHLKIWFSLLTQKLMSLCLIIVIGDIEFLYCIEFHF